MCKLIQKKAGLKWDDVIYADEDKDEALRKKRQFSQATGKEAWQPEE